MQWVLVGRSKVYGYQYLHHSPNNSHINQKQFVEMHSQLFQVVTDALLNNPEPFVVPAWHPMLMAALVLRELLWPIINSNMVFYDYS